MKKVAVMFAYYNRKEITKRCLASLIYQFAEIADKQFDVYAYDDGSADGTYEMLKEEFPQVIIIRGKGNEYWGKSMHYLMKIAVDKKYDFYMMINNDVFFYTNAIAKMFQAYEEVGRSCGIVGAFKSAYSSESTYGGRNSRGELLIPNGHIQQCIWANWNCFLVDNDVIKQTGIIDKKYRHAGGDYDYDCRMIKKGFFIYETADYIGECELNSKENTYKDGTLKRRLRLKKLFSPKGFPFGSFLRYHIKTKGIRGFFLALYGYSSMIGYILLGKEIE